MIKPKLWLNQIAVFLKFNYSSFTEDVNLLVKKIQPKSQLWGFQLNAIFCKKEGDALQYRWNFCFSDSVHPQKLSVPICFKFHKRKGLLKP